MSGKITKGVVLDLTEAEMAYMLSRLSGVELQGVLRNLASRLARKSQNLSGSSVSDRAVFSGQLMRVCDQCHVGWTALDN